MLITPRVNKAMVVPHSRIPAQDLALWLRADMGVLLDTTSTPTVSQWLDQSGNGRHATQATKTQQPTLINSSINGLPAVRFVNGFLTCFLVNTSNKLEAFVVFKRLGDNLNSSYPGLFSVAVDGTNDQSLVSNAAVFLDDVSDFGGYRMDSAMSETTVRVDNTGVLASTYYDGSYNVLSYNNVKSPPIAVSGNFNYNQGYIGRRQEVGTTQVYNGEMCELLVYHRELSLAERQKTNNYLKHKYDL